MDHPLAPPVLLTRKCFISEAGVSVSVTKFCLLRIMPRILRPDISYLATDPLPALQTCEFCEVSINESLPPSYLVRDVDKVHEFSLDLELSLVPLGHRRREFCSPQPHRESDFMYLISYGPPQGPPQAIGGYPGQQARSYHNAVGSYPGQYGGAPFVIFHLP
jgi:hypothetical protein